MKVLDNFLDRPSFDKIQETVSSNYFPWFYNDSILSTNQNQSIYDHQFIHIVIDDNKIVTNNEIFKTFQPLIKKIDPKFILRLKLNLNIGTHIPYDNGLHTDVVETENVKTAIFYINTNNGCTLFEDDSRVNSVENRLVVFDAKIKHQARTSTDSKARYVANINFLPGWLNGRATDL